jgi:hypothetical protein
VGAVGVLELGLMQQLVQPACMAGMLCLCCCAVTTEACTSPWKQAYVIAQREAQHGQPHLVNCLVSSSAGCVADLTPLRSSSTSRSVRRTTAAQTWHRGEIANITKRVQLAEDAQL